MDKLLEAVTAAIYGTRTNATVFEHEARELAKSAIAAMEHYERNKHPEHIPMMSQQDAENILQSCGINKPSKP
jgi:hypothetical protein